MNALQSTKLAFAAGLCLLLQACTAVYMTSALDDNVKQKGTCRGNAGVYFLPKAEFSFSIKKTKLGDTSYRYDMKSGVEAEPDGLTTKLVADSTQKHCLDFIANPLYSDVVRVDKDGDSGLLQAVYSNVADQSPDIIKRAAEGIATVAASRARSANRDFGATKETADIMKMQFDPFDVDLLSAANEGLRSKGYCIYIDPTNDPYVPVWMRNQCSTSKTYVSYSSKGSAEEVFSTASFSSGEGRFGILYKPLLAHTLVILKRDDPTSATPWRVWQRKVVQMPNRAPVFSIQVSRGLLTTRKTTINFSSGSLAGVEIDKQSELKALSEVFVNIVGIAVQIPAKALILRKTEAQNQIDLIKINQELLSAYHDLKEAQQAQAYLKSGLNEDGTPRSDAARSALATSALGACIRYAELSNLEDPGTYCQSQAEQ